MFHYQVYGLHVCSEWELSGFEVLNEAAARQG